MTKRPRCKKCGKFIKEKEAFHDGEDLFCGEHAQQAIISIHGISKDRAYHILENIQFGNGYRF